MQAHAKAGNGIAGVTDVALKESQHVLTLLLTDFKGDVSHRWLDVLIFCGMAVFVKHLVHHVRIVELAIMENSIEGIKPPTRTDHRTCLSHDFAVFFTI